MNNMNEKIHKTAIYDDAQALRDYQSTCNELLRRFCNKHDFDFEDAKNSWVSGAVGWITCCADYYVDMQTIIDDIKMEAHKDEFVKWYDYDLTIRTLGIKPTMNYRSWLRGAPRVSEERIKEVEEAHQRVVEAQRLFEECLKNEQL